MEKLEILKIVLSETEARYQRLTNLQRGTHMANLHAPGAMPKLMNDLEFVSLLVKKKEHQGAKEWMKKYREHVESLEKSHGELYSID